MTLLDNGILPTFTLFLLHVQSQDTVLCKENQTGINITEVAINTREQTTMMTSLCCYLAKIRLA